MNKKNTSSPPSESAFLRDHIAQGLRRQHSSGVAQGASAMCRVIYDKVTNPALSDKDKLAWVTRFCETLIARPSSSGSAVKE